MKTADPPAGRASELKSQRTPKLKPERGATSSSGVIAPSSSESIQELLDSKNAKIESYSRLKVGEGIEVDNKSFADEVAEQLK